MTAQQPGLLLELFDAPAGMEESAFHQWYRTYYVRRLRTIPGVQRVTRYAAREGSPRYLTLVEMQNTEVAMGNRFQTLGTRLKERQGPNPPGDVVPPRGAPSGRQSR